MTVSVFIFSLLGAMAIGMPGMSVAEVKANAVEFIAAYTEQVIA